MTTSPETRAEKIARLRRMADAAGRDGRWKTAQAYEQAIVDLKAGR